MAIMAMAGMAMVMVMVMAAIMKKKHPPNNFFERVIDRIRSPKMFFEDRK